MVEPRDAFAVADFVAECVETAIGSRLPVNFKAIFYWHARRLGNHVDCEDFGSIVLLEFQEAKETGIDLSTQDVFRLLDRIRHRLIRQAANSPTTGMAMDNLPTQEPAASESQIESFLQSLDVSHLAVFQMRFMDDMSVSQIAEALNVSPPTVYRWLASAKAEFQKFMSD